MDFIITIIKYTVLGASAPVVVLSTLLAASEALVAGGLTLSYYGMHAGSTALIGLGSGLTNAGLTAGTICTGATMLYHGTLNGPSARSQGLRPNPGPANRGVFVTPDKAAAENAINPIARGGESTLMDPSKFEIIEFRIPNNMMRKFPAEPREYAGWGGAGMGWREIEVSNPKNLRLLNQAMRPKNL